MLDRLTRFEPAYIRYKRVFDDIINKFSLDIKPKNLTTSAIIELVEEIVSNSLADSCTDIIKPYLLEFENKYFKPNELSYQYLSSRINYSSILSMVDNNINLTKNAQWMKHIERDKSLDEIRNKNSLLYPIEKILLCEGETERLLLPSIMKLFNIDFDKLGILLIPAGGKNQVARKYYSMIEYTKLPFNILLDKDATSVKLLIENKLRKNDAIYLIKSGEFEDLIPPKILLNAINAIHNNELQCKIDDFKDECSNVYNIENIYKKYGFGEYKKAHFAHDFKQYIENCCSKADFDNTELANIADFLKN